MKTFKAQAAQGDMLIIKVASIPSRLAIPSGLERIAPTSDNHIIVAHSETGHNHVMDADVVEAYKKIGNISIPIIVRLQGTNAEEGAKIIDESGLAVHSAILLKDAALKVQEVLA